MKALPKSNQLHARGHESAQRLAVLPRDLECRWQSTSVGPIYVKGRELIRRIFVTVRDGNWQEIAPLDAHAEEDEQGGVKFSARYESAQIDFCWAGRLEVNADRRRINFSMQGEVLRDGSICRLGLIVLLPPEVAAGATARIHGENGEEVLSISEGLGPQPIVDGWPAGLTEPFEAITLDLHDGGSVRLAFTGELFEIEDQRNWGDASFKIYCTPLARGFPRAVGEGDRIAHCVEIDYSGMSSSSPSCGDRLGAPVRFPELGVMGAGNVPGSAFMSVELGDLPHMCRSQLIELRLGVADFADNAALLNALAATPAVLLRVLLFGRDGAPPTSEDIAELRVVLKNSGYDLPILAAVAGYFVEYNRKLASPGGADGFAWPVAPTVHSGDLATVFENIVPFGPMAEHVRSLDGGQLAVSPLAWAYPARGAITAAREDIRLWLAAALIDAAAAGIDSIALDEKLVAHLCNETAANFDVAKLFALSGRLVRPLVSNDTGLAAIGLGEAEPVEWLVVNVTEDARNFAHHGQPPLTVPPRSLIWYTAGAVG